MPPRAEQGFILPATIWLLAIITIGASFLGLWVQRAVKESGAGQNRLQARIAVASTRSALLYMLAANSVTLGGLDLTGSGSAPEEDNRPRSGLTASILPTGREIPLDNTLYQGMRQVRFAIQDEQGLMGLNFPERRRLFTFLGLLGVPTGGRDRLIDTLLDYTDPDNFRHLNGAEAEEYARAGLPAPANRLLITVAETRAILSWQEQDQRLPLLATTATSGLLNLNTAPVQVIASWPGIGLREAAALVAARQGRPFRSLTDASHALGRPLPLDPLDVAFLPSPWLRITLFHPDLPGADILHLKLTPAINNANPWLIDHRIRMPRHKPGKVQAKQLACRPLMDWD
jgi:general secretion pathway protein K